MNDKDLRFRFKTVEAYPVISGIEDVYDASNAEIAAGFQRCMENRHLRRMAEVSGFEHLVNLGSPDDV